MIDIHAAAGTSGDTHALAKGLAVAVTTIVLTVSTSVLSFPPNLVIDQPWLLRQQIRR
jgi:hypothetical protein